MAARNHRGTRSRKRSACGTTILEILLAVAILGILAAAVAPLTRMTVQRRKEIELHRVLRIMRNAIDDHKKMADQGLIVDESVDAMGYPQDLETLVEGVSLNDGSLTKRKFLRRIPKDPVTNSPEWGLRSYQDEADSRSWGRENIFDVYSLSEGKALDGTYYKDW